jgi:hypothetical protein
LKIKYYCNPEYKERVNFGEKVAVVSGKIRVTKRELKLKEELLGERRGMLRKIFDIVTAFVLLFLAGVVYVLEETEKLVERKNQRKNKKY